MLNTTVIPHDICHTDYDLSIPSINSHQDNTGFEYNSKATVMTHFIDNWMIRESLKPFQQKRKKSSLPTKQKSQVFSNNSDIGQWNINQEHLIDGIALLLLQDKHLIQFFKMELRHRFKLIKKINELKR
ncbi:unnamed protein product [Adineta steineri]|uniref:Uncharacterized protein n=1 Tax=Adineta steineri TaxID=433720 RepID=A0A818UWN1_9BILA|nr:unnamed protein product [Adineta steineri]